MRMLTLGLFLVLVFSPILVEAQTQKDPVLFVHGLTGSASNWATMIARLQADGWPSNRLFAYTFSNPYDSSDTANVRNAQEIAQWVDNILRTTGASKIDIVAHSMGGISSRYYLKVLGGGNKVDDYITLSSPHQLFLFGQLAVLRSGDPVPPGVTCTCVYSPIDLIVRAQYAQLPGCNNVQVTTTHIGMLSNTEVYNIVKTRLN